MAGQDHHLKLLRLFDMARKSGIEPTEAERAHLSHCEECQNIIRVFAEQFQPRGGKDDDAA